MLSNHLSNTCFLVPVITVYSHNRITLNISPPLESYEASTLSYRLYLHPKINYLSTKLCHRKWGEWLIHFQSMHSVVLCFILCFFVASSSWETRFRPDSMAQRSNVNWTQRLQRTLKCLRVHTETRFVLLLSVGYHNDIACGCVRCYTPLYTLDDRRCCVI